MQIITLLLNPPPPPSPVSSPGLTFNPACDVEEALVVFLAHITRVQPSVVIDRLARLFFHVQIAHEYMTTAHANLRDE